MPASDLLVQFLIVDREQYTSSSQNLDSPIYTKRLESIEEYITNEREKVDRVVCIKKQNTNELLVSLGNFHF